VTLDPGDLLTVFSDGIPEATPDSEHFLGLDPVTEILVERGTEDLSRIRASIVDAVHDFLKGEPASDDVTLLLLRRSSG
jgi:sigma-B regulation protein RsbU (phosphoserine phosphatase)